MFNSYSVWRWKNIFVGSWCAGPLSSVWKEWIKWCIEFGLEANAIIAVPYDWRLSPSMLEERDLYFHKLKFVYLSLLPNPIIIIIWAHTLNA